MGALHFIFWFSTAGLKGKEDNRNVSSASKQKWQTVWIAFRWRNKHKKQTWCQRTPQKQILLRIYLEDLKQDSNFDESDIQELAETLEGWYQSRADDKGNMKKAMY
jgi:hypothetical protein